MRFTTQVELDVGGLILVTYDDKKREFENNMGNALLEAGDIQ